DQAGQQVEIFGEEGRGALKGRDELPVERADEQQGQDVGVYQNRAAAVPGEQVLQRVVHTCRIFIDCTSPDLALILTTLYSRSSGTGRSIFRMVDEPSSARTCC